MSRTTLYILVMAAVSYLIRVTPMTLLRRKIENPFIQSFLYYVPYVTLMVMTFPAIIHAAASPVAGTAALAAGILIAWKTSDLFQTAVGCCLVVFILELFL